MFFSSSSWNNGGGGSSKAKKRKGVFDFVTARGEAKPVSMELQNPSVQLFFKKPILPELVSNELSPPFAALGSIA